MDPALAASTTQQLLNLGIAGVALIVLGWYSYVQHKTIRKIESGRVNDHKEFSVQIATLTEKHQLAIQAVQERRIDDQKAISERLIQFNEKQLETSKALEAVIVAVKGEVQQLRSDLEEASDER